MTIYHYILAILASRRSWQVDLQGFLRAVQFLNAGFSLKELCRQAPELWMLLGTIGEKQISLLRAQFEKEQKAGLLFTYPGHELYPKSFLWLEEIPFFIQYRGRPLWSAAAGLSIVGTREPSQNSLEWLEIQMPKMKAAEIPYTISGGARGVDHHVHRLSLWNRLPTVIVVPSGLLSLYPRTLETFQREIIQDGGVLISEYESGQEMRKHHFQARNRLIAALGLCTLVIEAGQQSGTLLTAKLSLEQGKPVLVLPTHPMEKRGCGGLDLLCDGAVLVRDSADVCMHYFAERDWTVSIGSGPNLSNTLGVDLKSKSSEAMSAFEKSEKI